jgi:hypothetical protein
MTSRIEENFYYVMLFNTKFISPLLPLCVGTANSWFSVVDAPAHTRETPAEFSETLKALLCEWFCKF